MFWHCRKIQHVIYDKVYPCPVEKVDSDFIKCYKFVSKYCGFYPQIWLSQCNITMTGYHREFDRGLIQQKRLKDNHKDVLFGFDIIKGFPIEYDMWCQLLSSLMNGESVETFLNDMYKICIMETDDPEPVPEYLLEWKRTNDVELILRKYLFTGNNQFVVPSLNLKTARRIVCRNDKVRKTLRKMGFIEDRIEVRKML